MSAGNPTLYPGRITPQHAADILGIPLAKLQLIRIKGMKQFDPAFPPMLPDRTFVKSEIEAYKTLRDSRAAESSSPPAPPPVTPTSPSRERRSPMGGRAR